jgi:hypothetical protein
VASDSVAKELILSEKIETLLYREEKNERITEALVEACQSISSSYPLRTYQSLSFAPAEFPTPGRATQGIGL